MIEMELADNESLYLILPTGERVRVQYRGVTQWRDARFCIDAPKSVPVDRLEIRRKKNAATDHRGRD